VSIWNFLAAGVLNLECIIFSQSFNLVLFGTPLPSNRARDLMWMLFISFPFHFRSSLYNICAQWGLSIMLKL